MSSIDHGEPVQESADTKSTTKPKGVSAFVRELSSIGIVGVMNLLIDMGLFYYLVGGPLAHKVTTAKIVSGAIATVFAWVANRVWTFRHRENRPMHHEVLLFFVVNAVALAVTAAWVAFAHYYLGATSSFWIQFNALFGIGLGTIVRFFAYRTVVFGKAAEDPVRAAELLD